MKKCMLAAGLLMAVAAQGGTVNGLAPYDNTQNNSFWNTTERAAGVNSTASSAATVTLAGTGVYAASLESAFDSRPGTSAVSPARSLCTKKPVGLMIRFR